MAKSGIVTAPVWIVGLRGTGGPLTGAAFNSARALGPMIVTGNLGDAWLYGLVPIVGAMIAAVVHLGLSGLTHEQPAAAAAPAE